MCFAMRLKNLLFIIFVFLSAKGYSQISSEVEFFEATEYSDSDFVFVFCTDDPNGGSLTVEDSTGNGGYTFSWYKFNEVAEDFTDVLGSGTVIGDSISSITGLSAGGYMVTLTNAVPVQTYVAWVYIGNELSVDLRFDEYNECDFLGIWAEPTSHSNFFNTSFNYYDTVANEYTILRNKMVLYEWSNDNSSWGGFNTYNAHLITMFDLPTENTTFSVKVTDRFGCFVEDDIDYTAIETRAKLLWEHMDDRTSEVLGTGNNDNEITGPAPLYAKFTNDSKNGQDYIWFLGDTLLNNDIDTLYTSDYFEEPEHIYYYTVDTGKTYTLKLISESSYGCKDSVILKINVEPSSIEFPNVFSPNTRDGINDIFILTDYQSIRDFKITIFNRVGQVVHEYEGDVHDWKGWDGEIKNSSRRAPSGNYFVIFEVKGWDNVEYNNNNFKTNSGGSSESATEGTEGTESSTKSTTLGVLRLF